MVKMVKMVNFMWRELHNKNSHTLRKYGIQDVNKQVEVHWDGTVARPKWTKLRQLIRHNSIKRQTRKCCRSQAATVTTLVPTDTMLDLQPWWCSPCVHLFGFGWGTYAWNTTSRKLGEPCHRKWQEKVLKELVGPSTETTSSWERLTGWTFFNLWNSIQSSQQGGTG